MFARFLLSGTLATGLIAAFFPWTLSNESRSTSEQRIVSRPSLSQPLSSSLSKSAPWTFDYAKAVAVFEQATNSDPAPYVWIRASRDYLAKYVECEVDREKPASDEIMGIHFRGTSRTAGRTRLALHANENGASAELIFEGTIVSKTIGREGPATLHFDSNSTFRARKPFTITESGISTSPAEAEAPTRLTPTDIRTELPGLLNPIVKRIAHRRVAESQAKANAAASEHRADDIRAGLDARLNAALEKLQERMENELASLQLGKEKLPLRIISRSTPEFLEIALLPADVTGDQAKLPTFDVADETALAVRVHRTFVAHAMANPQLSSRVTALATGVLRADGTQTAGASAAQLDWSSLGLGSQWVAFDIATPDAARPDLNAVATDAKQN
jgi:hypothetical protein